MEKEIKQLFDANILLYIDQFGNLIINEENDEIIVNSIPELIAALQQFLPKEE